MYSFKRILDLAVRVRMRRADLRRRCAFCGVGSARDRRGSRCNAAGRGETSPQEVAADGRRCRDEVSLGLTEGNLET